MFLRIDSIEMTVKVESCCCPHLQCFFHCLVSVLPIGVRACVSSLLCQETKQSILPAAVRFKHCLVSISLLVTVAPLHLLNSV